MENTIMEQPSLQIENNIDVNEQIINKESAIVDSDLQNGSIYGKFKDATSLLEAYNNLEKEFTKKSQKLAEVLKQTNQTSQTIQPQTLEATPIFKNSNWQNEVSKFFEKNPEARAFSKEIANTIINDKDLAKHSNCLEYAYALSQLKKQVKPADLLNDPNHIDDILKNEKIKEKIISNYLQNVHQNKTNIRLISGESNIVSPTRLDNKPKTIKEASNILKKLLQS